MTLTFYDPGILIDEELELILTEKYPGDPVIQFSPAYKFVMTLKGTKKEVGQIQLRVGNTHRIVMYAGHIGYRVYKKFRGNHFAARSCKLLLPLACQHNLNPLWITANPDNWASRRTCEIVGAEMVEIVDVPEYMDMYHQGDTQKCRYRLDL
ncbi:MAG: GNAT family N-acetyltransferase [Anaerolineales bacterium]|jgi:tagatose 1,6-diphosphate aldolase